jgi:hypothetical protein
MQLIPLVVRLEQQLQPIENQIIDFLDASTIEKRQYDPFRIVMPVTNYYWGKTDEKQEHVQLKLLQAYLSWFEHFRMLFYDSPELLQSEIYLTHADVTALIEKKNGWTVPSTIDMAKQVAHENIQHYYQWLHVFHTSDKAGIILVPDTNALIISPDIGSYGAVIGQAKYTVVILPTVLSELDKLKITHRSEDFRKKVETVITSLKGLRQQGNMHEGVTVNRVVTVKMVAHEPDFKKTLSWLDSENNDDRVIASTLEVQRKEPSSIVILVTHDLNHQNKAEMANLPFIEPPDASTSSS